MAEQELLIVDFLIVERKPSTLLTSPSINNQKSSINNSLSAGNRGHEQNFVAFLEGILRPA